MTRDEVLGLWHRFQEAFASRDGQAMADLYAADAAIESPMAGSVFGRAAVVQMQNAFFEAFPDASLTADAPIVDAGRLAVIAEIAGTHVGTFLGFPATGKAMRFRLVFLIDIEDGQIVRERRVYDFTGLLVQVGVLKARPA